MHRGLVQSRLAHIPYARAIPKRLQSHCRAIAKPLQSNRKANAKQPQDHCQAMQCHRKATALATHSHRPYSFSTCVKCSSTGVFRPNTLT